MPRNRAWAALRCYVADALLTSGGVLRRLLGADPPAGFEIATATAQNLAPRPAPLSRATCWR